MKTIDQVLAEIDSLIERETERIREMRSEGNLNTVGGGMSQGAFDVLKDLKQFFLEPSEIECEHDFKVYETDGIKFLGCPKCKEIKKFIPLSPSTECEHNFRPICSHCGVEAGNECERVELGDECDHSWARTSVFYPEGSIDKNKTRCIKCGVEYR